MATPQTGIFALGTASHAYLEFDLVAGQQGQDLVAAISSLREPRTTMGGVNLVAGFRPELWMEAAPDDAPRELREVYEHSANQARGHRDVIRRFGRQPHRNAVLGRESTPGELEYLAAGDFVHQRPIPK